MIRRAPGGVNRRGFEKPLKYNLLQRDSGSRIAAPERRETTTPRGRPACDAPGPDAL